ncbi:inactive rhomboid protein 1-like [Actinia tenebrosa]|uniref:Inactive rhomboid protein 1-like n=1 Tax=Actinia tenebrosa TaxID=6105 RepID=A0A6P8H1R5_ACTTE|nr:inactive rhomboid protein 1-like [Actinia tenebrosa]
MTSQIRPTAPSSNTRGLVVPAAGSDYKHWPVFTCAYGLVQISMMIWVCNRGGKISNALQPIRRSRLETLTFRGPTVINHTEYPNPWYGPSERSLVQLGALFPPCMRTEHRYNYQFATSWSNIQLRLGREKLGCCEAETLNIAGTLTKKQCQSMSAPNMTQWKEIRCSQRRTGQNFIAHAIRPCCDALASKCHMTSPDHCVFIGGVYHLHAEHCYQVDCLAFSCDADPEVRGIDDDHLLSAGVILPPSYHQWWRFLVTIYLPHGIVDGTILNLLGLPICLIIERKIGLLRMVLVHTTAGVGGHLIGSLCSESTSITTGGVPSLAGIIVISIIYSFRAQTQSSRILLYLSGYFFSLVVLFILSSFPLVNNFSTFSGLILGIFLGFTYLPNLKLRREHVVRVTCLAVIILVFIICLFIFYEVQPSCSWCMKFSCVFFVDGWCE